MFYYLSREKSLREKVISIDSCIRKKETCMLEI